MTTESAIATQVYQLYIKASPEQIWEAITKPEFTARYFYGARITVTPERVESLGPAGELWGDEAVLEYDPPRRLVQEWSAGYDPELAEEEPSRVAWEIEPADGGICKLTVVHDRLEGAPKTAEGVAGGWMLVLSGLKTLLETGEPLRGASA
jgi:uncharacterized protein YndB with AHSA1/START domain